MINHRILKFLKNFEEHFRGAKVIILYPENERKFAEIIEKKLGRYTCEIMVT